MSLRVCLGEIGRTRGLRGEVRVRSFTNPPERLFRYDSLEDGHGNSLALHLVGVEKRFLIAGIAGVSCCSDARAFCGRRIYVARGCLPDPAPEEYYVADLIGLRVLDASGRLYGGVVAVHDFGAGDILEIALCGVSGRHVSKRIGLPSSDSRHLGSAEDRCFVPFTHAAVRELHLSDGFLVLGAEGVEISASGSADVRLSD